MAGFSNFFPEDVPAGRGGQTYQEGDVVVFQDNFYGATATTTLSDPVVLTDFDTNWALLSGGDADVAMAVDDLNQTENLTFWSGTRAEYNALGVTTTENTGNIVITGFPTAFNQFNGTYTVTTTIPTFTGFDPDGTQNTPVTGSTVYQKGDLYIWNRADTNTNQGGWHISQANATDAVWAFYGVANPQTQNIISSSDDWFHATAAAASSATFTAFTETINIVNETRTVGGYDNNTLYYITDSETTDNTFLQLGDTPMMYGTPGQVAIVNDDRDGLIFSDQSGGGGGITPTISSVTFINDYTGDALGTTTPTGATHGDPGSINYIEIAGTNFNTVLGTAPTVCYFPGTATMPVDLAETRVSNQLIRAIIPADQTTDGVASTARVLVTTGLGQSEEFTINFSEGPSLTSSGTFVAAEGMMVSVTITATGDTPITFALASGTTLPSWLTFTDNNDSTATISGTVPMGTAAGTVPYTITATDTHNQTENITVNIGAASSVFGASLGNSILLNGTNQFLERTLTAAVQNRTYSVWFKRGGTGDRDPWLTSVVNSSTTNGSGVNYGGIDVDNTDAILSFYRANVNDAATSDARLRDTSAWYHIVQSETVGGTPRIWLNGVEVTGQFTFAGTSQNIPSGGQIQVGRLGQLTHYASGYVANAIFVDGSALTANDFGEFSSEGYWQPIQYPVGATGSQGFILNFEDSSNFGLDSSSNGNNLTANGAAIVASNDTVTDNSSVFSDRTRRHGTIQDGGLTVIGANTTYTTHPIESGLYYVETTSHNSGAYFGLGDLRGQNFTGSVSSTGSYALGLWLDVGHTNLGDTFADPNSNNWGTGVGANVANVLTGLATNSVVGMAFDADARTIQWFRFNNANDTTIRNQSTEFTLGVTNTAIPEFEEGANISIIYNGGGGTSRFNTFDFGAGANSANFDDRLAAVNTATGKTFNKLSASNIADPTVVPQENFRAVTYDGNSASNSITGVGFQPDLVMIKNRTSAISAQMIDSIRGGAEVLGTVGFAGEVDFGTAGITFDADGFTIGGQSSTLNNSAFDYVAWCWRAGGTAVSNTDGTVTTMVSANPDAGFSIVEGNGGYQNHSTTWGHGLNQAPDIVISKQYASSSEPWYIFGNMDTIGFGGFTSDTTDGWGDNAFISPTTRYLEATATTVASNIGVANQDRVLYCFHSVPGYCDIGTYIGNGNADGPFINCGFKPAMVIKKRVDGSGHWYIHDNARNPHNPVDNGLRISSTEVEFGNPTSFYPTDFLSNGFKLISGEADHNTNGGQYLYMAFAESPFKYSLGR